MPDQKKRRHALSWLGLDACYIGGSIEDIPKIGEIVDIDGAKYEVLGAEPVQQYFLTVKPAPQENARVG